MVLERLLWRDMPELWEFPPLDSCQERILWAHKEMDLAPHTVVGLVLLQEVQRSFLGHLVSTAWTPFSELARRLDVLQLERTIAMTRDSFKLNFVFKADGIALPNSV